MTPRSLASICQVSGGLSSAVAQLLARDPQQRREGFDFVRASLSRTSAAATRSPLLGRDAELTSVWTAIKSASSGVLKAFIVEGEQGIGSGGIAVIGDKIIAAVLLNLFQ